MAKASGKSNLSSLEQHYKLLLNDLKQERLNKKNTEYWNVRLDQKIKDMEEAIRARGWKHLLA